MESEAAANSETEVSRSDPTQQSAQHTKCQEGEGAADRSDEAKPPPPPDQKEILRALEVVERDSFAIAQSFTSLFASLRVALSEVTGQSVDHMHCFSDAAGHLQECATYGSVSAGVFIFDLHMHLVMIFSSTIFCPKSSLLNG
ncbi:hypothetical protein RJ639_017574 [Escallonia herrerae]|uniref:Uncharacterized protein n=1 Tax=Escallonia herrerae TaxID=1293975 RepID=A0AA89AKL8_9ASTE|nr:hypothetical protein RJ639_017574 [Escallonia herrerae]